MALLFCDSFDHYATADITKKWASLIATGSGPGAVAIEASGRNGTSGIRFTGQTTTDIAVAFVGIPSTNTSIIGFALLVTELGGQIMMLAPYDGAAAKSQLVFTVNFDGSISVYRASASSDPFNLNSAVLLGTTAGGVIQVDVWAYVEVKVVVNNTTGAVTIRVDGTQQLALSGVDTQNTSNAQMTAWAIGLSPNSNGTHDIVIDDLYICSTTGSANTDFLGDVRIDCHYPTANSVVGWAASAGTNYECVDEPTLGTTDYVSTTTAGSSDAYVVEDLANAGGSIRAVQLTLAANKEESGNAYITGSYGTATGTTIGLSVDTRIYPVTWDLDPVTGTTWTESGFNAGVFGVEKV